MTLFEDLSLDENILKALQKAGYKTPTPIQQQAIPKLLEGKDLIASASTGTGKTAAFLLPILQYLNDNPTQNPGKPRALILAPTRELAMQIASETNKFSQYLPKINSVCVYGGVPYPIQKRALSKPYDILIATPGRLIDFLNQNRIDLSEVQILVLDEADRMLDMGFIEPVEEIASATPETRQTMLFSATMDKKIIRLSKNLQNSPEEIIVKRDIQNANPIEQQVFYVNNIGHKKQILDHLIENLEINQAIIFTSTKRQADELSQHLYTQGERTGALHGDMNQRQRTRIIGQLHKGTIKYLVATDVAARGIDISSLSHVFNFDLPQSAEDYIHRIGRTGRAGAKGMALSFATHKERGMLDSIEKLTNTPMSLQSIAGMEPDAPRQQEKRFRPKNRKFSPNKPFSSASKKPYSSDSRKPYSSDSKKPYSSDSKKPYSSDSKKPYSSDSKKPYSSDAKKPYSSDSKKPYSSDSRKPFSSASKKPFSSQKRKPEGGFGKRKSFRKKAGV